MENNTFETIYANLDSSIKMRIENIKKFLDDNNASLMIGAGFSKNADCDTGVSMKQWNELNSVFFRRLFCKDPECRDLMNTTPVRLASQVEASFGKNVLNEIIKSSLPDDRIRPSSLHIDLMKLSWHDVFTTNYDTLLERAGRYSTRDYHTVTNKESLLYTKSPRIIKLHGSFPNITPFIISEEDFRTYPQLHPEFVNTVRQALIENIFVLIGFSGNDPNFLNWTGWLRDIMGNDISPIYLVCYDEEMKDPEIKLMQSRGIDIINLKKVEDLHSYQNALDFFITALNYKELQRKWDFAIGYDLLGDIDYCDVIKKMKEIRMSYPGWFLLPKSEYNFSYRDIDESFPFLETKFKKLTSDEKQDFLYELDWRLNITLSPKNIDWYVKALEDVKNNLDGFDGECLSERLSLVVSLLAIYRNKSDYEKFNDVVDTISKYLDILDINNANLYFYEQSLQAIETLDYQKARAILQKWDISTDNYCGAIWKASIFVEIDEVNEAKLLLDSAAQNIRVQLLTNDQSFYLKSIYHQITKNQALLHRQAAEPEENFDLNLDFYEIAKSFLDKSSKGQDNSGIHKYHNFNVGSGVTQWNSGEPGFIREYSFAFRYLRMYEFCGYPMGTIFCSINEEDMNQILGAMAKFDFKYVLRIIIRSNNRNLINKCFSRNILNNLPYDDFNKLFDTLIIHLEKDLSCEKGAYRNRVLNVVYPLLSYLCVKCSQEKLLRYVKDSLSIIHTYPADYNYEYIQTAYNCMTSDSLSGVIPLIFEHAIEVDQFEHSLLLPEVGYDSYQANDQVIVSISAGLHASKYCIIEAAYLHFRVLKLHKCFSPEQLSELNEIIIEWRKGSDSRTFAILDSYNLVEYQNSEKRGDPKKYVKAIVDNINNNRYVITGPDDIQDFEEKLTELDILHKFIEGKERDKVVKCIYKFLANNEDALKTDDSYSLFGGLRRIANALIARITSLFSHKEINIIDTDTLNSYYDILATYKRYGFHVYQLLSEIIPSDDETKLNDVISEISQNAFCSNSDIAKDSINSIHIIYEKTGISRLKGLFEKLSHYIEFLQTDNTVIILTELLFLKDKAIDKDSIITTAINDALTNIHSQLLKKEYNCQYSTDIYFCANRLAGALSVNTTFDGVAIAKLWSQISTDDDIFNDIKVGFERGKSLVKFDD